MGQPVQVEYIWLDGGKTPDGRDRPQELRSKTKVLYSLMPTKTHTQILMQIPEWGFDGSSTSQAEGNFSDCKLKPVRVIPDPLRGEPHLLVLCEVLNPDGTVHASNTRDRLSKLSEKYESEKVLVGIEQEYTLFLGAVPLGFAKQNFNVRKQGDNYCAAGADRIFGRQFVEDHTQACLVAGLRIDGTNAEVMPGQWEFQVGPLDPLLCADQLLFARWLAARIGEYHDLVINLHPKPVESGDWNGAGAHTNFSTKAMREDGGAKHIIHACKKLGQRHAEHIAVYGLDNVKRLTGKHETASIDTFRYGVSDRGASIRIPMGVASDGKGYLEDRRPAANMDPYLVLTALLETICGDGFIA